MISVILSASPEARERALKAGFTEQTVLVRHESIMSPDTPKKQATEGRIMREIRPNQFFIGDFWGAGPD